MSPPILQLVHVKMFNDDISYPSSHAPVPKCASVRSELKQKYSTCHGRHSFKEIRAIGTNLCATLRASIYRSDHNLSKI